jgi:hypothetical protein
MGVIYQDGFTRPADNSSISVNSSDSVQSKLPERGIMTAAKRIFGFALLLILSAFISPCLRAQGQGAHAAGINISFFGSIVVLLVIKK